MQQRNTLFLCIKNGALRNPAPERTTWTLLTVLPSEPLEAPSAITGTKAYSAGSAPAAFRAVGVLQQSSDVPTNKGFITGRGLEPSLLHSLNPKIPMQLRSGGFPTRHLPPRFVGPPKARHSPGKVSQFGEALRFARADHFQQPQHSNVPTAGQTRSPERPIWRPNSSIRAFFSMTS